MIKIYSKSFPEIFFIFQFYFIFLQSFESVEMSIVDYISRLKNINQNHLNDLPSHIFDEYLFKN